MVLLFPKARGQMLLMSRETSSGYRWEARSAAFLVRKVFEARGAVTATRREQVLFWADLSDLVRRSVGYPVART